MNPPPSRRLLRSLSALAGEWKERLETDLRGGCKRLAAARESLQDSLGREISADECAEMLSQAIAASLPLLAARRDVFEVAGNWLLEQSQPWEQFVLEKVLRTEYSAQERPCANLPHLYEHFLAEHQRQHRKRGGVFYTPEPLVRFITRRVHKHLQEEFGLVRGLADTTIIDPAAGTGAFLLGVIDLLRKEFPEPSNWSDFVVRRLLPRLGGIEIIPAACLSAKLNIAVKLFDTGFDFSQPGRIRIELGNSLSSPQLSSLIRNLKSEIRSPLVLLGNPPFSSLSGNRGEWITGLVRGSRERPGYVLAGEERLAEKKTWLHDDYVKFIRLAQWLVEEAGSGIVGFVTNHGYLDNVTFRLMRRELLRAFPRIDVLDLHGNRRSGEGQTQADENVFGLDQGIAISFLRRLPNSKETQFRRAELWGTRDEKLRRLEEDSDLPWTGLSPQPPSFLLTPALPPTPPEYVAGWPLPRVMTVSTSAPVTARDHFVVALTREELCRRLTEFCNLSIPDDEIRRRYFTRTRSAKYSPGDTRSWKLAEARRIIAAEPNWPTFIRRCLYRPFDWRYVFWHPAMVDWPRESVVRRLQISDLGFQISEISNPKSEIRNSKSLILLTRRQMLPSQPCSFFWMADTLPLDGVIRSDNRGSESLFPLYLRDSEVEPESSANFASEFLTQVSRTLELRFQPHGAGDLTVTFGPEDLFYYIYALFHSPTYRERYAAELRTGFPRVLLPKNLPLFARLVPRGERLAGWHTLHAAPPELNGETAAQLLDFRAGGHQPLRRAKAVLTTALSHPLAPYLAATLHEMEAIDHDIETCGSWPGAFAAA